MSTENNCYKEFLENYFYEKQNYDIALLKIPYSKTINNEYSEIINYNHIDNIQLNEYRNSILNIQSYNIKVYLNLNIFKDIYIEKIINCQCFVDNVTNIDALRAIILNNDYNNNFNKGDIVIVLMLTNKINRYNMSSDDKDIIKNIYSDIGDIYFVLDKYEFISKEKNIIMYIPFTNRYLNEDSMFEYYNIEYNYIYMKYNMVESLNNFNIKYPKYLKTLYYDSSSSDSDNEDNLNEYSDNTDNTDNSYNSNNNYEDTVITL